MIKYLVLMVPLFIFSCNKEVPPPNKVFFYNGKVKTPYYHGMTIDDVKKLLGEEIVIKASLDYRENPEVLEQLSLFEILDEKRGCFLFFNFYKKLIRMTFIVHPS